MLFHSNINKKIKQNKALKVKPKRTSSVKRQRRVMDPTKIFNIDNFSNSINPNNLKCKECGNMIRNHKHIKNKLNLCGRCNSDRVHKQWHKKRNRKKNQDLT